jgi:hypothetical protein
MIRSPTAITRVLHVLAGEGWMRTVPRWGTFRGVTARAQFAVLSERYQPSVPIRTRLATNGRHSMTGWPRRYLARLEIREGIT